ncbi:hypothetical protein Agub_g6074 [Astrephomene gubernaculifera]|uniref:Uncharacterized protein n=1 Tax=Astrephomene gubernaculifera TaxID=47775 RepID=A0AAD3DRT1_9CHLO|nr:hypothetical protein Agub_g6074 [Astrephomene gubernaculifera]
MPMTQGRPTKRQRIADVNDGGGERTSNSSSTSLDRLPCPAVAVLLRNVDCHSAVLQRLAASHQPPPQQQQQGGPRLLAVGPARLGPTAPQAGPGESQQQFPAAVQAASGANGAAEGDLGRGMLASQVEAALARGGIIRWRPEDVQVMLAHIATLPPGPNLQSEKAVKKLGLAHLPDPGNKLRLAVAGKVMKLRNILANGEDPLEGRCRPRVPPGTYNFRAWLRRAFMALPNQEGTSSDAAAILEADPEISPKLDRRPDRYNSKTARWLPHMRRQVLEYPEFVFTGRKRGRNNIYRYDTQVAQALDERPAKTRKRGLQGVPHLGKASN